METWKLLLITLLSAVVLGCIIGVVVGKHQIKRNRSDYKPLLTPKERIIYTACIVVGAGCILFGVLYTPPAAQADADMGGMLIGPDGQVVEGVEGFEGDFLEGGTIADQEADDNTATGQVADDQVDAGQDAAAEDGPESDGEEQEAAAGEEDEAAEAAIADSPQANPGAGTGRRNTGGEAAVYYPVG